MHEKQKNWVQIIIFFCQNDTYAKWINEVFDMSYVIESHLIKKYDAEPFKESIFLTFPACF